MELLILFLIINALLVLLRGRKKIAANWQYLEGLSFERCGLIVHPGGVADNYERAIVSNPDHAKAHFRLGIVYNANGYYDEGRRELEKAFGLAPELKSVSAIAGAAKYAKKYLIGATQRLSEDAQLWHNLAMLHYALDNPDEAVRCVRRWEKREVYYVVDHYAPENYKKLTEAQKEAVDYYTIRPGQDLAKFAYGLDSNYAGMAERLINTNQLDVGDKILRMAIGRNHRDQGAWQQYKILIGKVDGHRKNRLRLFFEEMLKHDRDNLGAWQCLGEALADLDLYYELQDCNAQVKRLDLEAEVRQIESPIERDVRMRQERRAHADELIEEAISIEEEGGLPQEVLEKYHEAITIECNHPHARYGLGMMYYQLGRYYSARTELCEAASIDQIYNNKELIAELDNIVEELNALSPKYFKPRSSPADYGVDASDLEDGKVIDLFRTDNKKAISVKCERKAGDEPIMFYRYKTFFYDNDDIQPSCVVRLEISAFRTCCITKTDLKTRIRENFGLGHEDMAYEEFKYQAIKVMKGEEKA